MEFKRTHNRQKRVVLARGQHSESSAVATIPHATAKEAEPAPSKFIGVRKVLFAKPTIISLVIVCCIGVALFIRTAAEGSSLTGTPSYDTVLPKGKSIDSLGGWKRVSPPQKDPVFAYTDTIDGVSINVSEQPLPPSFKSDTNNQVAELAQKFSATDKLSAGNLTAYIGASSKGPQSVILAKNNLLILLKSAKKIEDTSWTTYIQSLQ